MNRKISSELFIPFHSVIMLAEEVINFADKLHVEVEEVNRKGYNEKSKDNTENYKNNFHIICPDLSDVHIQPHREHP